mmetsp:Transcript_30201/g.63100  ORF Transcript_30201/g.63100 Transcript_30201/m.63100 type:complete len:605 (-) Transcript_30201:62-1876(-)
MNSIALTNSLFIEAPVTESGDEKRRRCTAHVCKMSDIDENVAKNQDYCTPNFSPQSILHDIPEICKATAEAKTPDSVAVENAELLKIGSRKFTPRQIVRGVIRSAKQDGQSEDDKEAISNFAPALGVSRREVEGIRQSFLNSKTAPTTDWASVLFEKDDCEEAFPASDRIKCVYAHIESAPVSALSPNEPVPIVLISDPGQDLDDEMMFVMSSHLQSLGLISLRGVVANLHPSLARARLTLGTLNLLGLHDVPVGIGTDGGDTSGIHSSKHFEATSSSYIIKEEDEAAMKGLENGQQLLQRLYQVAPEIEYVEAVERGTHGKTAKKDIKGGLTIVLTSSLKDISIFVHNNPIAFASKTREVVVMGGCEPILSNSDECKPDSANNNTFDPEASVHFYSQCQMMNVTLTVVSRYSAYAAKMPRSVYDDLALTGSAIGVRLRNSQCAGIDQLWQRASSPDPSVRKGLPPRCDREWFINTFCGGNNDPTRSGEDSVWDLVTGFMQYDTLALLASVPRLREALFDPSVLPPLRKDIQGENNGTVIAYDTGTRNLIGVNEKEHGIKEPILLMQLLTTGYRQGILCNHDDGLSSPPEDRVASCEAIRHQIT